jgi:hypothetical protein
VKTALASDGPPRYVRAAADLDVIRAWWTAHPMANIGLRTGISFDVVDLDSEDAVDVLESVRAGREPIRGPMVQTAHGFHWYVKPTGMGNRAGVLPGVDFRGKNGYVIAPPSVHPDGHRCRWVNPLRDDLGSAPSWFVELITPERTLNGCKKLPVGSSAYGRAGTRPAFPGGTGHPQRLAESGSVQHWSARDDGRHRRKRSSRQPDQRGDEHRPRRTGV